MKNSFIKTLKNTLTMSIQTSSKAHDVMRPRLISGTKPQFGIDLDSYTKASVLIALFPDQNTYSFPIIEKTKDGGIHSGQMALPGGKMNNGENEINCALREFSEELGIDNSNIDIVGKLGKVPIAPSQFLVTPLVGLLQQKPYFSPDPREVKNYFVISLNDLLDTNNQKTVIKSHHNAIYEIPYFDFHGNMVWGATAMILFEFFTILKDVNFNTLDF